MEQALRAGVTHFDTAQDYGQGHSETVVGQFAATSSAKPFLATKAATCEPSEVLQRVRESLSRLKVSAIDLFYIHWPKTGKDPAHMVEALENCRSRGLIKAIGVSNFSVPQMEAAAKGGRIDYHQMGYNLAWRFPEEEVLPFCREYQIQVVAYSPMAQGLLTNRGSDPDRWAPGDPRRATVFYQPEVWPRVKTFLGSLGAVAAGAGLTLEELALRWVLTRPGVRVAVAGASSSQQLQALVEFSRRATQPTPGLDQLEEYSLALRHDLPAVGNMFLHYP
jgi:aryl-alcohol dehydrogenase-like predicted oxidoreductase